MTVPTISNLPTVPATSDPNFETEAPALFNHIKNTFVSEMNSAISFINSSTFDATVEFKNSNFTAARNFLYMIDTSSAGVSVTLPLNPSTGDQLLLMDQKRSFGTNNLTIGRNSQNINGAASNVVSKSTGALIRCIFQASYGWTVDLYEGEWESGTSAGDLVYNGGNVGIGTSAPSAKLSISETTQADENLHYSLTLNGNDAGTVGESTQIFMSAMTSALRGSVIASELMDSGNSHDLIFKTNSASALPTEKMRITGNGDVELSKIAGRSYHLPSVSSDNPNLVIGTNFNSIPIQVGDEITFYNNQVRTVTSVTNTQLTVDQSWDVSFANTSANGKAGIGFNTKDTERMRITADGNVGIGTSSPGAKLEVESASGAGNTNLFRLIRDGGYGDTTFNQWYTDGAGTPSGGNPTALYGLNMGLVVGSANNGKVAVRLESQGGSNTIDDSIVFRTANSDKVFIDSSGNVEVNTGNLVIGTAGKGIDFSASSHFGGTGGGTGMSSELLDDYEEGTFTPAFIDTNGDATFTHDVQKGRYTKIGDCVYFQLFIGTDAVTEGTGSLKISGLPFTAQNTDGQLTPSSSVGLNYSWDTSPIKWSIASNSDAIILYKSVNPLTPSASTDLRTTANTNRISIEGFYHV